MSMYVLEVKAKALKELASLPKKDQERIVGMFDVLRENPFAGKQLEGKFKGLRSLRVWPYRIIYVIDQRIITVTVLKIGHRKDVYR